MTFKPIAKRVREAARQQRGTTKQRGYDGDWQRVRLLHLQAEPLCRPCRAIGWNVPATVVDHIKDIATHPHLRLDDENLQSMCAPCHNRKTYHTRGRAR